jgi:hypothetical protein
VEHGPRRFASYATKIIVRRIGRRYRAGARSAAARGEPHAVRVRLTRLGRIHQKLSRKGVTLLLLWEEYVAEHAAARTWR